MYISEKSQAHALTSLAGHAAEKIDLSGAEVIKTGRLQKTGAEYSLLSLSNQNIGQMLALQELVFANLSEKEKSYLAANKDRDFFERHFAAGNEVLGIVQGDHLIAQALIFYPAANCQNTGIDTRIEAPLDTIAVLQGAIVDPAYRGNALQGVLIEERLAMAERRGRKEIFCQVAIANSPSWSVLLKKGMHIENIGRSPYTGAEVYVMHGYVSSAHNDLNGACPSTGAVRVCPYAYIGQQKALFAIGYKGTMFDPVGQTITFQQCH
jgi:ribosomal protein S18 acetylase RimI-like enzyme